MLDKPIFIISLNRTGSTLLKNIINKNSEVAMATDEMHIFDPFLNSFGKQFYKFGDLKESKNVEKLFDYIFNGNIRGTFWKDYKLLKIDRKTIINDFKWSDRSLKSLIEILLYRYQKKNNKNRVGAKYPLHFSKSHLLKDWFKDSKIILLHRDIKAICASKLNDKSTISRRNKYGFLAYYATMLRFCIEYIWQIKYFLKNQDQFYLIDYNQIVSNPMFSIKNLCEYCDIKYEKEMLNVSGKDSSLGLSNRSGIHSKSLDGWKNKLSKYDILLITKLTIKYRKYLDKWI